MKKTKILSIFALFIMLLGTVTMYSCSKSSSKEVTPEVAKNNVTRNDKNSNIIRNFDFYGQLHNQFLTEVKNNFQMPSNILYLEDGLNYSNNFAANFINSHNDLSSNEKTTLQESCNDFKQLWHKEGHKVLFFEKKPEYNNQNRLFQSIESLYNRDLIDSWEKTTLEDLALLCENIYNRQASHATLVNVIQQKSSEYQARNYNNFSKYGRATGVILAITINSNEWWSLNLDAISLEPTPVVPVVITLADKVAGDLAGAITGAGWARLGGGDEWGMFWGAVGGAMSGSGGGVIRACMSLTALMSSDTRR